MRVERDDIDLLLFLELMQRSCRIFTGDEMSLNSNAFQIGSRPQLFEIMCGFFAVPFDNAIG